MPIFSRFGRRPDDIGVVDGRLTGCPGSPNCATSDGGDGHDNDDVADACRIAPIRIAPDHALEAWRAITEIVATWPRTKIVTGTANYLHAECRSAILGFVDDLELHLRPEAGEIGLRSASRLGYSDFGVNRRRLRRLRDALRRADSGI